MLLTYLPILYDKFIELQLEKKEKVNFWDEIKMATLSMMNANELNYTLCTEEMAAYANTSSSSTCCWSWSAYNPAPL